jgi:hypothetical protein
VRSRSRRRARRERVGQADRSATLARVSASRCVSCAAGGRRYAERAGTSRACGGAGGRSMNLLHGDPGRPTISPVRRAAELSHDELWQRTGHTNMTYQRVRPLGRSPVPPIRPSCRRSPRSWVHSRKRYRRRPSKRGISRQWPRAPESFDAEPTCGCECVSTLAAHQTGQDATVTRAHGGCVVPHQNGAQNEVSASGEPVIERDALREVRRRKPGFGLL